MPDHKNARGGQNPPTPVRLPNKNHVCVLMLTAGSSVSTTKSVSLDCQALMADLADHENDVFVVALTSDCRQAENSLPWPEFCLFWEEPQNFLIFHSKQWKTHPC